MKVFLSWSGDLSHKVALLFRDWLPSVIQSVEPYVSSEDIDKGARWSTDIAKELESSSYGILCVTRENMEAPWLHFEAGALSKSVDKSSVSPFLFAIKRSEVKPGPIHQFQSTVAEKDDVRKLLLSINAANQQSALDEVRLNSVFEVWWPQLEEKLKALEEKSIAVPTRKLTTKQTHNDNEILEELLELVRQQHRVLNDPTILLPQNYLSAAIGRNHDISRGHPIFNELAGEWIALREQVQRAREREQLPSEAIFRAIDRLAGPLEYVIEKFGRAANRYPHPRIRKTIVSSEPIAG